MKCLVDLDGTLVNFCGGAAKIHGKSDIIGGTDLPRQWKMRREDFWKPLDWKFWENLEWIHDGHAILDVLVEHFGWSNIMIFTSDARNPEVAAGKISWIQREIPQLKKSYIIGRPKPFIAGPNLVLIDDLESNVDGFVENGGKSILVGRPYNRGKGIDNPSNIKEQLVNL